MGAMPDVCIPNARIFSQFSTSSLWDIRHMNIYTNEYSLQLNFIFGQVTTPKL